MSSKSGTSTKSYKPCSSKRSSKSGSSRLSKVNIEERAIEENLRLAEVIAESNFADQRIKIKYYRKKLEMKERVAKIRAKVFSTLGDISLQKYRKEDKLLT